MLCNHRVESGFGVDVRAKRDSAKQSSDLQGVAKNPLAKTAHPCHFEPFAKKGEKSTLLKRNFALWFCGYFTLLRKVQYDNKTSQYDKDFVILSVSEKSTEFKICLKALKLHFKFMDTSLRSVWQNLWHKECLVWQDKSVWQFYKYDKKIVIASRFLKNGVAIHKFSVAFSWLATQKQNLTPKSKAPYAPKNSPKF